MQPETGTPRAATSTSPIRSSAMARSTWSSCPAGSRTSSTQWEEPAAGVRLLQRLGVVLAADPLRQARHRAVGPRPGAALPTLEQRMDDVRAVMDAVGSERAPLFGASEGGPMCAAVRGHLPGADRAPWSCTARSPAPLVAGLPLGRHRRGVRVYASRSSTTGARPGPVGIRDPSSRRRALPSGSPRYCRLARARGRRWRLLRMNIEIDVRHVLPTIRVPTLVLHGRAISACTSEAGRYLAEHIPGAKYVELPGDRPCPLAGRYRRRPGRDRGVPDRHSARRRAGPRPRHGPVHRHRRLHRARRAAGRPPLARAARRATMRPSAASWRASVAGRSTRPATASWRRSTARPAPSAAPWRSPRRSARSAWRCGPACTPARSS